MYKSILSWFYHGFNSDNDEERSLAPGKREMINTNISISIPHHTYARIAPRSGLALRGIDVVGGVVDADYRGLVQVILVNNSTSEFVVKKGDRIAQLIFEVIERPAIVECRALEELGTTNRGSAGFGSTGR